MVFEDSEVFWKFLMVSLRGDRCLAPLSNNERIERLKEVSTPLFHSNTQFVFVLSSIILISISFE